MQNRNLHFLPATHGRLMLALAASLTICAAQPSNPAPAANANNAKDPFNRETPQSSVYSFEEACHAKNYGRAARYLDLRNLEHGRRSRDGAEYAQQLCGILERDNQFDAASLSPDPQGYQNNGKPDRQVVDTFNVDGKTIPLTLERVTLRSQLSVWLFSPESVAAIPQLSRMTSESPFERMLPDVLVQWIFLDTSLWRWIALLAAAFLVAILSRLFSRLALWLLRPVLSRLARQVRWMDLNAFVSPLQLLLAMALFRAVMEFIGPSGRLRFFLDHAVSLLFLGGLGWLFVVIADVVISRIRIALQSHRQSFSYSVLPLASRVAKLTIVLLTIAAVLGSWGYNTTSILAGLGIGGIAVALAAQKTIENLFGGVAVISDRPVTVGDFCKFGNQVGTIEDIGLRSTRIRSLDRTLVTVPNSQFAAMTLENFTPRDKMLFHFTLNLRRDTRPDQLRTVLNSIGEMFKKNTRVEAGDVPLRFVGIGTYSLDIEIFVYVLTADFNEFLRIQQDLLLAILDAIQAAGTALALPTQANIFYSRPDNAPPNGYPEGEPQPAGSASRRT